MGGGGEACAAGPLRLAGVVPDVTHPRPASREAGRGYSAIELLFALGLLLTLSAAVVPQVFVAVDRARATGAARYLAGRIGEARLEAVRRSADVGFQFTADGDGYLVTLYLDGNANGIRSADIRDGTDAQIAAVDRLPDRFPGVDFGLSPGLPPLDPGAPSPSGDPIKLGVSDILSFSPLGSSSSGTLFLRGRGGVQLALRMYGPTGKARLLELRRPAATWDPL